MPRTITSLDRLRVEGLKFIDLKIQRDVVINAYRSEHNEFMEYCTVLNFRKSTHQGTVKNFKYLLLKVG